MLKTIRLLSENVNLKDYPDYAQCPRVSAVPGCVLMEQYAVQGIRLSVPAGCLAATAYFFLYHRPRLSFSDRSLARLHHYFYPSAGYTTPIGALGGVAYGVYRLHETSHPERLVDLHRKQIEAAKEAFRLREQRRAAVASRASKNQTLYHAVKVWAGLADPPSVTALQKLGLQRDIPWQEMLIPYSLAWVSIHSLLCDPRWYQFDNHLSRENLPAIRAGPSQCLGSGRFTKLQIDDLVSRATLARRDPTNERWTQNAGRCASCGVLSCSLFWKSGSLLFRCSMGLGLGIFAGSIISAMKLDEIFQT